MGGGPVEHTGKGVRQERSRDQGTQGGDYDSQTECQPPERMSASGDLRPTLRQVIVPTRLAGPPGGSAARATGWASLNHVWLLYFPGHCSSPPGLHSHTSLPTAYLKHTTRSCRVWLITPRCTRVGIFGKIESVNSSVLGDKFSTELGRFTSRAGIGYKVMRGQRGHKTIAVLG